LNRRSLIKTTLFTASAAILFYYLLVTGFIFLAEADSAFAEADNNLKQEIKESYDSQDQCLKDLFEDWCTSKTTDCKENAVSYCKEVFPK
jgi:hypothetical protein